MTNIVKLPKNISFENALSIMRNFAKGKEFIIIGSKTEDKYTHDEDKDTRSWFLLGMLAEDIVKNNNKIGLFAEDVAYYENKFLNKGTVEKMTISHGSKCIYKITEPFEIYYNDAETLCNCVSSFIDDVIGELVGGIWNYEGSRIITLKGNFNNKDRSNLYYVNLRLQRTQRMNENRFNISPFAKFMISQLKPKASAPDFTGYYVNHGGAIVPQIGFDDHGDDGLLYSSPNHHDIAHEDCYHDDGEESMEEYYDRIMNDDDK